MPNSYTAPIYEGKQISLEEFATRCARGMGFFIHQRDDSLDAPLRHPGNDSFGSLSFHEKELQKARAEFLRFSGLSEEERYAEWSEYYKDALKTLTEQAVKRSRMRTRYLDMIARVQATEVSGKMESFKEFMLNTLNESMEFDCPKDDSFTINYYTPREYVAWAKEVQRKNQWNIDYHTAELEKVKKRNAEQIEYIEAFERDFGVEVQR